MTESFKKLSEFLERQECEIASTYIYERSSKLVPYSKTKSSLLLSDKYLYIDEFFNKDKREIRNTFKFNYVEALNDEFKFFESIDREKDFATKNITTIKFEFLNKYNTFVFSSIFPKGGLTEISKMGSTYVELYDDKDFINKRILSIEKGFIEKII